MSLSKSISLVDVIFICILFVVAVAVIIFCLWRRKSPPSLPAQASASEVAMTPLSSRSTPQPDFSLAAWSTPAQPDFSSAASSYYSPGLGTPSPYTTNPPPMLGYITPSPYRYITTTPPPPPPRSD